MSELILPSPSVSVSPRFRHPGSDSGSASYDSRSRSRLKSDPALPKRLAKEAPYPTPLETTKPPSRSVTIRYAFTFSATRWLTAR